MTAPGRYAANDGSFARSAGGAAARGGVLIAIAIVIGVLLLSQGFDGGEQTAAIPPDVEDAGANGDGGTSGTEEPDETDETPDEGEEPSDETSGEEGGTQGEDPSTEPTVEPVAVDPPESVKVAVLNGRGEPGLGKARSDALIAAGYVAIGVNAATFDNELSRVYYTPGYEDEAKAVATALNGGSSTLDEAPADPLALVAEDGRESVSDFHIFVLLGADEALG